MKKQKPEEQVSGTQAAVLVTSAPDLENIDNGAGNDFTFPQTGGRIIMGSHTAILRDKSALKDHPLKETLAKFVNEYKNDLKGLHGVGDVTIRQLLKGEITDKELNALKELKSRNKGWGKQLQIFDDAGRILIGGYKVKPILNEKFEGVTIDALIKAAEEMQIQKLAR